MITFLVCMRHSLGDSSHQQQTELLRKEASTIAFCSPLARASIRIPRTVRSGCVRTRLYVPPTPSPPPYLLLSRQMGRFGRSFEGALTRRSTRRFPPVCLGVFCIRISKVDPSQPALVSHGATMSCFVYPSTWFFTSHITSHVPR